MGRYYRNYGRSGYKRGYNSSSNNDSSSAIFFIPALLIVSFFMKYMASIQNFFVTYGVSILNYIITLIVLVTVSYLVIMLIKKISSYRSRSVIIPTKSSIANEPRVADEPTVSYSTSMTDEPHIPYSSNISNEPTIIPKVTVPNYDEQNLSQYIYSDSNKDTENTRDINIFLKESFPSIVDGKNIYGLNGYLRWLHSKIVEDLIKLTFELNGFQIIEKSKWVGKIGFRKAKKDGGIDLICEKDGKRTFVQVKAKVTDLVTDDVIRNLHGSTTNKRKYGDDVIAITTTLFSPQAKKTALEDSIRLIDYSELNKKIDSLYKNESYRKTLQYFFINNSYPKEDKYLKTNRECPNCGAPLKFRQNHGKTPCYGCTAFCGHLEYLN